MTIDRLRESIDVMRKQKAQRLIIEMNAQRVILSLNLEDLEYIERILTKVERSHGR